MQVHQINHITLRCRVEDLAALKAFYSTVLGLEDGPRPAFSFAGHWLYSEGQPIVHLAALAEVKAGPPTGHLDHVAFTGRDLPAMRAHLKQHDIPFKELPVPGFALHQIFLTDPGGLKIELTFRT